MEIRLGRSICQSTLQGFPLRQKPRASTVYRTYKSNRYLFWRTSLCSQPEEKSHHILDRSFMVPRMRQRFLLKRAIDHSRGRTTPFLDVVCPPLALPRGYEDRKPCEALCDCAELGCLD